MKSGNLNFLVTSGPLQACNGTVVPFTNISLFHHNSVSELAFELGSYSGFELSSTPVSKLASTPVSELNVFLTVHHELTIH